MNATAAVVGPPSLARLTFRYAARYRRLVLYMSGFLIAETVWFAYAGYAFRGQDFGWTAYAPLAKCAGGFCSGINKPPPFYVTPLTNLLVASFPAVWAVIFVAPSVAKEFESKSVRFTWTQGITRNQWLASRVLPGLVGALLISAVAEVEARRWIFPRLFSPSDPWTMFPLRGSSTVALAVLLVAVSILSAILLRRPLLVVLVTALAYGVLVFAFSITEPTLIAPKTTIAIANQYSGNNSGQPYPQRAQLVGVLTVTKDGTILSNSYVNNAYQACSKRAFPSSTNLPATGSSQQQLSQNVFIKCMASYNFYNKFSYQPGFRFWEFQWIYSAIAGGATLLLIWLSVLLLKRVEP